jgi:hypothetical protein
LTRATAPAEEVTMREPTHRDLIALLDRVLDKGVVIDASVRVSLVGIQLVGIDAHIVVVSIGTYLHYATATEHTVPGSALPEVWVEEIAGPAGTDSAQPGRAPDASRGGRPEP